MKNLDIENIEKVFEKVINSSEWKLLQSYFNKNKNIYLAGNGGNSAIADHGAIDMTRHTDKNINCAGSAVLATSIINDVGYQKWTSQWLEFSLRNRDVSDCMFIGISASGTSKNLLDALDYCEEKSVCSALITAKPLKIEKPSSTIVVLGVEYYHTAEVLSLMLMYELIVGSGFDCPKIK